MTFRSISSESCVICSCLILGTDVFRGWSFQGSSFSLSCNGCQLSFVSQWCHHFEGKVLRSYEDWINFYLLINLRLQQKKWYPLEWTTSRNQYCQLIIKVILGISHFSIFISPIYTFSFTPTIKITKETCRLWRETNTIPFISSFTDRVFSIVRRKMYGSNPSQMDTKVLIPAPTQK